jgi:DNA-binding NtrC family response regulator
MQVGIELAHSGRHKGATLESVLRILAVDDDPKFLEAVKDSLKGQYEVATAADGTSAMRAMSQSQPDLVLLDFCLPQMSGLELLKIFIRRFPDVPIIMLTAEKDADTIIETMKSGASDFVIKATDDFEANLKYRIGQVFEKLTLVRKNQALQKENQSRVEENKKLAAKVTAHTKSYEILGISAATLRLKSEVLSLKGTDSSVLITGENGTGKELVAQTLNQQEDDPGRPFIDVNCPAIPAALFESEFFGHAKGSFTGSTDHRDGKFKLADGGDIFLDEVGEIPLDLQAKLLRVLQEKTFTPVGSNKPISVNVRVIAATNRDLEEEVRQHRFREDLYYRLNPIRIHVPPLRERKDDILFLAEEFLRQQLPMGRLTETTKLKLAKHPWYGNIRELHNIIERAVVLAKGSNRPTIKPEHIVLSRADASRAKMSVPDDLLPGAVDDIAPEHFERCLNWMERQYMTRGLVATKGDNEILYTRLSVSRAYYFKRKKLLGLLGSSLPEGSA